MTILAAVHIPDTGTLIGCDSLITSGNWKGEMNGIKWLFNDNWAIGVSGDLSLNNLIEANVGSVLVDGMTQMDVSRGIFSMLESESYKFHEEEDAPKAINGGFLLANSAGVCEIDPFGGIFSVKPGDLAASGSGAHYALGAFHGSKSLRDMHKRLRLSLTAAIAYDPFCGGKTWTGLIKA